MAQLVVSRRAEGRIQTGHDRAGGWLRWRWWAIAMLVAALAALAGLPMPARAATLRHVATTGTDSGDCSTSPCRTIGYALGQVAAGDTIAVAAGTYFEHLTIGTSVTLQGAGAGTTILDGGRNGRVITVNTATTVNITGLTIRNGVVGDGELGAGISNQGTLSLTDSIVTGNQAGGGANDFGSQGGGIFSQGALTLTRVTVSGNSSGVSGGGITLYGGTLTMTDSTISGNTSFGGGGLYSVVAGTVATVTGSTFTGNSASDGGGILDESGTLTVTNSTFDDNHAGRGGAVAIYSGTVSLRYSTLTNNTGATGGDSIFSTGTLSLTGAILDNYGLGNFACDNLGGTITSGGYNLARDSSCGLTNTGDIQNADPLLGPLAANGGLTETAALLAGSPAIDAGGTSSNGCPATDQRGVSRPQGAACDIGAYERPPTVATALNVAAASGVYGGTATLSATLTASGAGLGGKTVAFTLNGAAVCGLTGRPACPVTNSSGVATLANVSLSGIAAGTYVGGANSGVGAAFAGDNAYDPSGGTATLTVSKATATVTLGSLTQTYNGQPRSATVTTSPAGLAVTFTYDGAATPPVNAGAYSVVATIADANYQGSATGTLTITRAKPTLTWSNPADIVYGAALGPAQLNATASVSGTFTYTPPAGTVLKAGSGQLLAVSFVPNDTTNYTPASAQVTINVLKATPVITWNNPVDIVYGTPLGGDQLNATAAYNGQPVAGSFTYTPPAGTILNAGAAQQLRAEFAPTDTANFTTATSTVTITVLKATATLTLANLNQTYDGTPKFATVATSPAGLTGVSLAYSQNGVSVSAPVNAGSYTVVATLDNPNYAAAPVTGTLVINKATPIVTWATPADIVYGTALSGAQLNATASVPGTFTYTPPAGTVLRAGAWTLRADFVPADTANYTTASATVTLNVRYATGDCLGAPGRTVLPPVNADGTSVFKQGRTVPVKFRVCDASGHAIGTPGVVVDFKLVQVTTGTTTQVVNEDPDSTTLDSAFRWDATDQQWIFNLNTKPLAPGAAYTYRITLNDGTAIVFAFSLR